MSKKILIPLLAIVLIALGAYSHYTNMGDVMTTRVVMEEIEDGDLTSDEVFAALEVVRKDFRDNFSGCTLTDLTYNLANNDEDDRDTRAKANQAQESVLISGNIIAEKTHEDYGLEADNTYTGYLWLLTRSASDADWEIREYNYQTE